MCIQEKIEKIYNAFEGPSLCTIGKDAPYGQLPNASSKTLRLCLGPDRKRM